MIPSSRIRWLNGRYANVDGIPFKMPVRTQTSPAMFAAFAIDADQAAGLLPGQELQPLRLFGHGLLVIAVVNYLDTTIGKYVEFCIGVMVTHGTRRAPALPALALRSLYGTGVYIYDLPVSTEISVKGGLGIWGMPKRQANLDYIVGEETVSTQYDLDGQLVVRLDIPRPRRAALPMVMNGVAYGGFRGMLYKSYVHLRGGTGVTLGGREARLLIGDHPRAEPLKHLAYPADGAGHRIHPEGRRGARRSHRDLVSDGRRGSCDCRGRPARRRRSEPESAMAVTPGSRYERCPDGRPESERAGRAALEAAG